MNKMVDRVAIAIVGGLKLKTTIGPAERHLAIMALMALTDHWEREMRFGDARDDIAKACMPAAPSPS